jgi:hypothetical protein
MSSSQVERRRSEGPRLALTMADMEAGFGDFGRALYWADVARAGLGRLPAHYRERHDGWRSGREDLRPADSE